MKTFKELFEVMSVQTRKKMARRMAKLVKSPAFQFNPAKLHMAARKKATQSFRDKFYPSYADMSLQQKVKVDQLIMQKYGKKIDKISKKMALKLRKQEMERIKKARKKASDA